MQTFRLLMSIYFVQEREPLVLLGFGHVLHEQEAERVQSMRRFVGTIAVSQVVAKIPLHLIEANGSIRTKQKVWVKKQPNEEGTERNLPKLMKEEIVKPIKFLHSKVLYKMPVSESSALKLPEPNAPL